MHLLLPKSVLQNNIRNLAKCPFVLSVIFSFRKNLFLRKLTIEAEHAEIRWGRRILHELSRDGRLSNSQLAERGGLSPSPCWQRTRRLEAAGF